MTGELNRRVTIKTWTTIQDAGGGSTATESASYSLWAKVENRTGRAVNPNGQLTWDYDYKITVRYEASREIKSNMTVLYDSKKLKIESVSFDEEGRTKFQVLRCSAVDNDV